MRNYISNIFGKLQAADRAQAILRARCGAELGQRGAVDEAHHGRVAKPCLPRWLGWAPGIAVIAVVSVVSSILVGDTPPGFLIFPVRGRKNESLITGFRRWVKHEDLTVEAIWLPFARAVRAGQ